MEPKTIQDLRHRYFLTFRSDRYNFGERYDRALAFAARATSSFPGAFPPARIRDIENHLGGPWEGLADFLAEFWGPYTVSGRDARRSAFVDGGVLDNAPFALAIDGIRRRPATTEVDRRLMFIEPDPQDVSAAADETLPTLVQTVWGGLSTIPRAEPVLDDLLEIQALNERVERAKVVMAAVEADIAATTTGMPVPEDLAAADACAHADAKERLGVAEVTYRRLKLFSVLDGLAELAAEIANLPPASTQAFFVKDVIVVWAGRAGLLKVDEAAWENIQLPFLRDFDLG